MKKTKKNAVLQALPLTLPTGWGDLTGQQVLRIAYYFSLGVTEPEMLLRLGAEFSDLKPRGTRQRDGEIMYMYYHRTHGNVLLNAEHMAAIASALKWVVGDPGPMQAPPLDGYTTPDSRFYGITLEQYMTAEAACGAYLRTKNPHALRMLTASLYPRRLFDPDRLEKEAGRLSYLPVWQLSAVLLWFCGAKQALMKKYPYVFSTSEGEAPALPGDEVLLGLLSSLNDGRVADNDAIKRLDVHEAFYELNLKIKNSQKK